MKIGVALSGCDIGGVSAYRVLRCLEEAGIRPDCLSVSSIASVPALLYACGRDEESAGTVISRFIHDARSDMDAAVAQVSVHLSAVALAGCRNIAVSAVNIPDGRIAAFTNDWQICSDTLHTYPLLDAYDVLSAAVSPAGGLKSYRYRGMRLCDYSVWHGSPVYLPRMMGAERVLSISFVPAQPRTPWEALSRRMTESAGPGSDLHICMEFPGTLPTLEDYNKYATEEMKNCMNRVYREFLF